MHEWQEYKLGDLFEDSNQGVNTTTEKVKYSEVGVPVIRAKNIFAYNIDDDDIVFVDSLTFDGLKRSVKPVKNDVLYTNIGSQLGNAALVNVEYQFLIAWNVFRIIPDTTILNPNFLVYLLNNPKSKAFIRNLNSSSTMPFVSGSVLRSLEFKIPPLWEQKAISAVLSSLDDKIDLLHRQNKTLEALAQTLFRHWFVDGAEDDWEVVTLQDVCTITRGASPRPIHKYIENGTVPWIKIADATRSNSLVINETKEFIIEAGVSKSVEVFPGDLILSNSATAGLPFFVGLNGCIHDGWLLFREFKIPKNFVYFLLYFATRELIQMADGTVQKNLNTTLLKEYEFSHPPRDLMSKFSEQAESLITKINANNDQIILLEKLRDTLLPKLMSGQVRVRL